MAKAIEAGVPSLESRKPPPRRQARIDAGKQAVIGVKQYKPVDEAPIDVLKVENSIVRRCRSTSCRACGKSATRRTSTTRWPR